MVSYTNTHINWEKDSLKLKGISIRVHLPRWLSWLRHSAHRPGRSVGGAGVQFPGSAGRFRVRISALSRVVSEIFNVEKYCNIEIPVKVQSRSLKVIPWYHLVDCV